MVDNDPETTPNELEQAIQKRNKKYQKMFKQGGGNCCKFNNNIKKNIYKISFNTLYLQNNSIVA